MKSDAKSLIALFLVFFGVILAIASLGLDKWDEVSKVCSDLVGCVKIKEIQFGLEEARNFPGVDSLKYSDSNGESWVEDLGTAGKCTLAFGLIGLIANFIGLCMFFLRTMEKVIHELTLPGYCMTAASIGYLLAIVLWVALGHAPLTDYKDATGVKTFEGARLSDSFILMIIANLVCFAATCVMNRL